MAANATGELLRTLARMKKDGEDCGGCAYCLGNAPDECECENPFDLESDDAVESLHHAISEAREILRDPPTPLAALARLAYTYTLTTHKSTRATARNLAIECLAALGVADGEATRTVDAMLAGSEELL